MDKDSLMYGMDVLDEISGALEPIGLTVRKLDAEETQGLPVGLIVPIGEEPAFSITCHVLPTHKDQVSTTFVQLFLPLTEPCPEKLEEMEAICQRMQQPVFAGHPFCVPGLPEHEICHRSGAHHRPGRGSFPGGGVRLPAAGRGDRQKGPGPVPGRDHFGAGPG